MSKATKEEKVTIRRIGNIFIDVITEEKKKMDEVLSLAAEQTFEEPDWVKGLRLMIAKEGE